MRFKQAAYESAITTLRQTLGRFSKDGLLRSSDFRRLWLSSALTQFGSQITLLALPICAVLMLHATPAQMGTLAALESLPFLLFGLPSGVLLDRCRRLPIMMCSDAMVAIALASVPLAWWLDALTIHWLYAVGFVLGTGLVVGGSAEQVFLTFVVGRERLVDAQAKLAGTESAARLLGPGMAGAMVQLLGAPVAILCNVAGFVVSLANLRRIRAREPQPAPSNAHPLHDIREGLAFVWQQRVLRTLAWTSGAWHFLFYGYLALHVLFATRVLNLAPGVMGTAQMLGGAGILAGSILVKPLSTRYGTGRAILVGLCVSALGFALMPAIPASLLGSTLATAIAYGGVVFLLDCGATLFFVPYIALRQRVTPDAVLGRMVATMRSLTVASAPLGALAAGALAERFSVRIGLVCIAAGALVLAVTAVVGTRLRHVND
ncbi:MULTISPECIES: MFS transporter [unclassified Massilia]|uniref:MFS transporter n=1 Tax=unclassified Massilia TaxID=2609279 RepID=UPI001786D5B7|nr:MULTISPECIES: MFS transporter [unclassified Massilia]MBD8529522.1 MFS transporter [Massilia sp. CFBP 13647]MBD8673391.1 MFS transporter [Massilia sp. CFBP 13721]